MQIRITARHSEIPADVRERAEDTLTRLGRLAPRPVRAAAVFDLDHQRHIVELQMHLPRQGLLVAKAEATEFRTALDRAADKLRHQIEKEVGRLQQVKAG
ncbi:MAG: ribosome-associated translation inhibitor RaiA [Gemmatimonadales bacterium]